MPSDDTTPAATTVLGPRFARAVEWVSELHAEQRRKGTDVPYVSHLLGVASLVLDDGGSETEAIAALLHDAIEDAHVKPKQIRRRFGRKVTRIVKGCTEKLDGEQDRSAATWRARKEASLTHLGDPATPVSVLRVRAADALFNARSIVSDLRAQGPETWQRFHAGAVDQLWYYRSLAIVLARRHPGRSSEELRVAVGEMEALAGWWFDVGDPQPGKSAPG